MPTYSITSFGGVNTQQTLAQVMTESRSPHYKWIERLRTGLDFITSENTLICIADSAFTDSVQNVYPIGIAQSFSWSENIMSALVGEVGSRRKRAIIGNSQGGNIQISQMVCLGQSSLNTFTKNGLTIGTDAGYWSEQEWTGLIGLNHDKLKTPIGIVTVEATPDGRNYVTYMFEQCVLQGQSRGYQAGQHLVVDNFSMIFEQIVPLHSFEKDSNGGAVDYVTTL